MIKLTTITILLMSLILGCATTGINIFTREDDIRLGEEFSKEIAKQYPILKDREITAYFNRIGQSIARNSDWADLTYHFQVVNTEDVNAFAIPGGWIYVHRGLIERADNLSEVAGVMAHEISHVVARHGTKQLTKQYGAAVLGQLVLGEDPALWQEILANLFTTAGILHYGRQAEFEADRFGVKYTYKSGYDPRGMITFFQKLTELQKSEPGLLEKLFSTHPPTTERIAQIKVEIRKYPPLATPILDDPEFHRIRAKLGGGIK